MGYVCGGEKAKRKKKRKKKRKEKKRMDVIKKGNIIFKIRNNN